MRREMGLACLVIAAASFAAAAPARGQTPAEDARPVAAGARYDWTADSRRFVVGDVVSVLIDEYTLASANQSWLAQRDRTFRASAGGRGELEGTGGGGTGEIRTRATGESRERGQTLRQDRIATEITARVVAIEPNGMLRIEGRKRIVIDRAEQTLVLSGLLRPQDVKAENVVDSWRLADAEIAYSDRGGHSQPRRGIVTRIIGWLWP